MVQSTNRKTLSGVASSRCMTEVTRDAEICVTVERWTCALDCVLAVLNDQFLLFRDGPPLESLPSESLCAVFTTPNEEKYNSV
ncbi:hypothetical protein AYI68_g2467 [Smittium mucronatum]|uniref:Uncharacterized protein n=1 Tax=Smittium mucronatum TaxID=133383 RepID=A0A1R0H2Q8_9FUNG|nr:hypothetical protein AYI68_g2467 [Smittium mucronatum]